MGFLPRAFVLSQEQGTTPLNALTRAGFKIGRATIRSGGNKEGWRPTRTPDMRQEGEKKGREREGDGERKRGRER